MTDLNNFDPNGIGLNSANIFGLPFNAESAEVILIPVPWEVTVSYRTGTAHGPEGIFNESYQVDLFDADAKDAWKKGFYMPDIPERIKTQSISLRKDVEKILEYLAEGHAIEDNADMKALQDHINQEGTDLNEYVYQTAKAYISKGKKVALIGGDHSTPFGIIRAVAENHKDIGVLQIDAHADLREAYEGFHYSHASIMYNVIHEIPEVNKLVQVGIRDFCDEEFELSHTHPKIKTFYDRDIKRNMYEGALWKDIVETIINELPQNVYISFDADGLDPKLCPNTGTPVPGGFEMEQVFYLFKKLKDSGRHIVGFDVNEVSTGIENDPLSIDLIVGARLVYKLCSLMVS